MRSVRSTSEAPLAPALFRCASVRVQELTLKVSPFKHGPNQDSIQKTVRSPSQDQNGSTNTSVRR